MIEKDKMWLGGRYVMDKDKHKSRELRQVRFRASPEERLGFTATENLVFMVRNFIRLKRKGKRRDLLIILCVKM